MDVRIKGLRQQLVRAQNVLDALPEEKLTAETPLEGFGTIGEQFRHLINYVQVLLRDYETGVIDFNDRDRSEELETDKNAIDNTLSDLYDRVTIFIEQDPEVSIRSVFIPVVGEQSVTDGKTLGDAINYVSDHSYHHVATIRLLSYIQGVEMPADAGLAPATELHRKRQA